MQKGRVKQCETRRNKTTANVLLCTTLYSVYFSAGTSHLTISLQVFQLRLRASDCPIEDVTDGVVRSVTVTRTFVIQVGRHFFSRVGAFVLLLGGNLTAHSFGFNRATDVRSKKGHGQVRKWFCNGCAIPCVT